jgi:hypothetical protein
VFSTSDELGEEGFRGKCRLYCGLNCLRGGVSIPAFDIASRTVDFGSVDSSSHPSASLTLVFKGYLNGGGEGVETILKIFLDTWVQKPILAGEVLQIEAAEEGFESRPV